MRAGAREYEVFESYVRYGIAQGTQMLSIILHILQKYFRWFLVAEFTRSEARARVIDGCLGVSGEMLLKRQPRYSPVTTKTIASTTTVDLCARS